MVSKCFYQQRWYTIPFFSWKLKNSNHVSHSLNISKIILVLFKRSFVVTISWKNQKFCNILVHASLQLVYHMTEAVQAMISLPAMVGSIVVVCVLICYAFLHSKCDLKVTLINMQHSLIQELILYGFNWAIIIFTSPSARAGYDTRSIFKQSLTGLNSVFLLD